MENKSLLPSDHRLLTAEEERTYGQQVQDMHTALAELETCINPTRETELKVIVRTGEKARDMFFMHNINLVRKTAHGYLHSALPLIDIEDLIQWGMLGLSKAIDKFDPSRGNKFSTVAIWWIRQSINRNINNNGRMIRIPENRLTQITKMNMILRDNQNVLTEHDLEELVKSELGLDDKTLQLLKNATVPPGSLDAPVRHGNDMTEKMHLSDTLIDPEALTSEQSYLLDEANTKLRAMVNSLTEEEVCAVLASYDMDYNGEKMSKESVTERFGWTARKFTSVKNSALKKLRQEAQNEGLKLQDFIFA